MLILVKIFVMNGRGCFSGVFFFFVDLKMFFSSNLGFLALTFSLRKQKNQREIDAGPKSGTN